MVGSHHADRIETQIKRDFFLATGKDPDPVVNIVYLQIKVRTIVNNMFFIVKYSLSMVLFCLGRFFGLVLCSLTVKIKKQPDFG
ncbi:MAG: hypothetical protein D3925_14725 [Candidatus Electrothrix sp. AR5]|nr:hypothetical protein [Candidatus Electrothrix sp. AR5]